MERSVYNAQHWRDLPRDYCSVDWLLSGVAGPCKGLIHHHHVDPTDPGSRTIQVCNAHHQKIHAVLRGLQALDRWDDLQHSRKCPHKHRYQHAREACERRLNAA